MARVVQISVSKEKMILYFVLEFYLMYLIICEEPKKKGLKEGRGDRGAYKLLMPLSVKGLSGVCTRRYQTD